MMNFYLALLDLLLIYSSIQHFICDPLTFRLLFSCKCTIWYGLSTCSKNSEATISMHRCQICCKTNTTQSLPDGPADVYLIIGNILGKICRNFHVCFILMKRGDITEVYYTPMLLVIPNTSFHRPTFVSTRKYLSDSHPVHYCS